MKEFHQASDVIVNNKASFVRKLLDEPHRKVLTQSQLKKILLREKVKTPEWYAKKDVTGRVKLIQEKKKLHRAIVMVQFSDRGHKSYRECQYHIFDAIRDTRNEFDVEHTDKTFEVTKTSVDVPKL